MGKFADDWRRDGQTAEAVEFEIHAHVSDAACFGTVSRHNEKTVYPFSGWLELMLVLERLRAEAVEARRS